VNCFQARKEFPNFWRERLDELIANELADHLECCGLCEQAYRLFALTAPVLHSDAEAVDAMLGGEVAVRRPRRMLGVRAGDAAEQRGMMWTALSMLVAASVIAYIAAATPKESLTDALTNSPPASAISAVQEPPAYSFLDDFAG
jgi:hypothetical protein